MSAQNTECIADVWRSKIKKVTLHLISNSEHNLSRLHSEKIKKVKLVMIAYITNIFQKHGQNEDNSNME